ncbi:unnamed protein product [Arabis nemorensis]|uniref:phosphoglycerate mutase (2,3-diphosphoglycerate-independent) n=1 Tax=Arabis nemorensis TaxID=586526 RepID=A0A565AMT3_9BRAS|nr:unnamed protein product [Arabis nemorensis]
MKKNIDVYDFNEDDELAESAAGKLLEKFTNPSPCNSPVLQRQRIRSCKFQFRKNIFGNIAVFLICHDKRVQNEELEGTSCAEAGTAVVDHQCEDSPTLVTEAEESGMSLTFRLETRDRLEERDGGHDNHGLMFGLNTEDQAKETDVDHDNHGLMFGLNTDDDIEEIDVDHGLESFSCQPDAKTFYAGTSSYSQHQLNSSLSDSSSSQDQNDMLSAVDESLSDRSALSQASDSEGDEDMRGCPPMFNWVLISMLYVLKDWMTEHCFSDVEKIDRNTTVIMTPEYVLLKDTSCAESLVMFSCNGIKIKSYLANNEEAPFSCEVGVEDIVNIEELKFAVKEHNWPEKQPKINSLHVKYPAVWNADLECCLLFFFGKALLVWLSENFFAQGAKLCDIALASGKIFEGEGFKYVSESFEKNILRFLGLLSDGGVHSRLDQLLLLIKGSAERGAKRIRVHILTDGRDVLDGSSVGFVETLEADLAKHRENGVDAQIASGGGRMYVTLDRCENDWEVVKRGWDAQVLGENPHKFKNAVEAVKTLRKEPGANDQYLPPFVIVDDAGKAVGPIVDGDAVVTFNFRADRVVMHAKALEYEDFDKFGRVRFLKIRYAGMLEYDGELKLPNRYLVTPPEIDRTSGEYLVHNGIRIFACSETVKFGHVTFFWNGNRSGYFNEKLEEYVEIPSDSGISFNVLQVPIAIGGPGLSQGVRFRKDLETPGLANVAATVMNLHGFVAPADYELK